MNYTLQNKIINTIKNGGKVLIPIKGISMKPTLIDGDVLVVQSKDIYFVNDIVVFRYLDEGYLVHRIIEIKGNVFICKGDNSKRKEIIMKRQVLGKVIEILSNRS